ncbi:hypothetical protein QVD17_10285 [Tagetes erecta]|uniref:Uncharacterized protein n=1 Tax=Tagetes erecta TaxID=13708 RepID=A0AAD8L902_TARER|nr:hypothetical protein QVD17_10285 [Tagetes erecta]
MNQHCIILNATRSGEDEKRRGGSDGVLVDEEGMSFGRWQEANEMKTRQRGDEDGPSPGEVPARFDLVAILVNDSLLP